MSSYVVRQRVFGDLGSDVYALDAALSPAAATVAVPLSSGTAKLYDASGLSYVGELTGHTATLNAFTWAGEREEAAASASSDGTAKLWDVRTRQAVATLQPPAAALEACSVDVSGNLIAVGASKGQVSLYDARTHQRLQLYEESHGDPVTALQFSGVGGALVSASTDGLMCVFDLSGGTVCEDDALQYVLNTGSSVGRVGFCGADGGKLWATTHVETLQLWDWRAGEQLAELPGARSEVAARLFPAACVAEEDVYLIGCHAREGTDEVALIAGSADGNVALFPVRTAEGTVVLEQAAAFLAGGPDSHGCVVRGCAMARDGRIYTAGEDGAVCQWATGGDGAQAASGSGGGSMDTSGSGGADKRGKEAKTRRAPY